MRKSTQFLSMVFIAIFILTLNSCSKDEESSKSSYLTFNGETYEISKGASFIDKLLDENGDEYDTGGSILLYASTLDIQDYDFVGYGCYLEIELSGSNKDIIGTYNAWTDNNDGPTLGDVRFFPESNSDYYNVGFDGVGKVVISKTGDNYKISISLESEEGTLDGYFEGKFSIQEYNIYEYGKW